MSEGGVSSSRDTNGTMRVEDLRGRDPRVVMRDNDAGLD